jgi:predicted nucleic-acid-binding protein
LKIAVDTNVLVRGVMRDDLVQAEAADRMMRDASVIAIGLSCLCELAWVLRSVYGLKANDVLVAFKTLLAIGKVSVNRPAVEAGLAVLQAGGDFADGVIAHEGRWLGGETFVSFDRQAIALLSAQGHAAQLPS